MNKAFEVRRETVMAGTPAQVWDAVTARSAGWIWPMTFEPRVGGRESGLTSGGGVVAEWEPPRRFVTRASRPDGWRNELTYTLAPSSGGTAVSYLHASVAAEESYDVELDACERHTDFYLHSLGEYVRHFAGRDARYVELSPDGSFASVCALVADAGVVDYRAPSFLGVRTDDALVRVFDRSPWGGSVSVYLHLFAADPDVDAWTRRLAADEVTA